MRKLAMLIAFLAAISGAPHAGRAEGSSPPVPAPAKLDMTLVAIFGEQQTDYVFVIGAVGFKSVETLKAFLSTRPAGTELIWAPGCERLEHDRMRS